MMLIETAFMKYFCELYFRVVGRHWKHRFLKKLVSLDSEGKLILELALRKSYVR
jgi:hypothetical protein